MVLRNVEESIEPNMLTCGSVRDHTNIRVFVATSRKQLSSPSTNVYRPVFEPRSASLTMCHYQQVCTVKRCKGCGHKTTEYHRDIVPHCGDSNQPCRNPPCPNSAMWDVLSWDQHPGGVDEGLQVDTWLCEKCSSGGMERRGRTPTRSQRR